MKHAVYAPGGVQNQRVEGSENLDMAGTALWAMGEEEAREQK